MRAKHVNVGALVRAARLRKGKTLFQAAYEMKSDPGHQKLIAYYPELTFGQLLQSRVKALEEK
jgi:hypothetical protein